MNISQEYEIENLLNDLGIEVDDSARISDGEITYFVFSTSNLEPDKEEIVEKLEIDKSSNGLYCSSKINYNPNEILEIIKPIYSNAPKERGIDFRIKQAKRQREAFKNLIDKESLDPNLPFDFIKLQINLLENCIEFFDTILKDYD